jgi:hypothetical protein
MSVPFVCIGESASPRPEDVIAAGDEVTNDLALSNVAPCQKDRSAQLLDILHDFSTDKALKMKIGRICDNIATMSSLLEHVTRASQLLARLLNDSASQEILAGTEKARMLCQLAVHWYNAGKPFTDFDMRRLRFEKALQFTESGKFCIFYGLSKSLFEWIVFSDNGGQRRNIDCRRCRTQSQRHEHIAASISILLCGQITVPVVARYKDFYVKTADFCKLVESASVQVRLIDEVLASPSSVSDRQHYCQARRPTVACCTQQCCFRGHHHPRAARSRRDGFVVRKVTTKQRFGDVPRICDARRRGLTDTSLDAYHQIFANT